MNKANNPIGRLKLGLGTALLAVVTGCVGVVDGGYGGGDVFVPGPDVVLFGGGFERGHDVRGFSHRGAVSRAVAHPGGFGPGRRR